MQVSKIQDGKEVYEGLDFAEVNFNGNSSQESQNLQQNTKVVSDTVSLKNTEASVERTTLKLTGEFDPSNKLSTGTTIPLTILTEKNGENTNIEYECTVKQTSPGELDCDTSSNPLKTTVQNLHLSAGTTSDNTLVTVYMKDLLTQHKLQQLEVIDILTTKVLVVYQEVPLPVLLLHALLSF